VQLLKAAQQGQQRLRLAFEVLGQLSQTGKSLLCGQRHRASLVVEAARGMAMRAVDSTRAGVGRGEGTLAHRTLIQDVERGRKHSGPAVCPR